MTGFLLYFEKILFCTCSFCCRSFSFCCSFFFIVFNCCSTFHCSSRHLHSYYYCVVRMHKREIAGLDITYIKFVTNFKRRNIYYDFVRQVCRLRFDFQLSVSLSHCTTGNNTFCTSCNSYRNFHHYRLVIS